MNEHDTQTTDWWQAAQALGWRRINEGMRRLREQQARERAVIYVQRKPDYLRITREIAKGTVSNA